MNYKGIILFITIIVLITSSFGGIIQQINLIFSNDYIVRSSAHVFYLVQNVLIFLISNWVLFFYVSKGWVPRNIVKFIYVVFIIFNLTMMIPTLAHIFFIVLFDLEYTQLYGLNNPLDHTLTSIFLQLVGFMFASKLLKIRSSNIRELK